MLKFLILSILLIFFLLRLFLKPHHTIRSYSCPAHRVPSWGGPTRNIEQIKLVFSGLIRRQWEKTPCGRIGTVL